MAESLTPDQRSAYEMFLEVTANARDEQTSLQILRSCDWNVERALELAWAAPDDLPDDRRASSSAGAASSGAQSSFTGGPLGTPLLANSGGAQGAEATGDGGGNPIFGFFGRITRSISNVVIGVIRSVLFVVGGGFMLGSGNVSGAAFRQTLVNANGGPNRIQIPQFFEGSFGQAVQAARAETKLLVIYLHSEHARYAQAFCQRILAHEFVRQVLDENFVVWGGDIAWMESHHVSRMIHARQYPHFSVILPASVDDIRVIGALEGDTEADAAVALLTACMGEMDSHRAEMVARREQHVEDRSLREAQDREYQEAMELDRQRDEERKKQAKLEEEAQQREEEKRKEAAAVAHELKRQRTLIIERRQEMAAAMGSETDDATARLSLRLPAGQRIQRKFRPDSTLAQIYEWAECSAYLPENKDKGLDVPARFTLKTSFPSTELTEKEKTVQELQLAGTSLLLAQIEDDD